MKLKQAFLLGCALLLIAGMRPAASADTPLVLGVFPSMKGAISYLPKEKLAEIGQILNDLLAAQAAGEPTWKLLFEKLGDFFDEKFGPGWKEKDKDSWSNFSRTYQISKGIQPRLARDEKIVSKGI